MALISCPDCKRQVSSLAVACPQCARPIASDPTLAEPAAPRKEEATASRDDVKSLDPGALARQYVERVTARTEGVTKTCVRCGRDVTDDIFRVKSARGYTCGDCQDTELEERVAMQERWRRLILGALIFLAVGIAVLGAMTATSFLGKSGQKK